MKPTQILYLHGYQSSPNSHKCQSLRQIFEQHSDWDFIAPHLQDYANHHAILNQLAQLIGDKPTHIIGSSLGGLIAHLLKQNTELPIRKVILINPVIKLETMLSPDHPHASQAQAIDQMIPENPKKLDDYLIMLQQDDLVCPFQMAREYYTGARQIIGNGQGHGFENIILHQEALLDFLGLQI